jgi:hypothetical protein
MRSPSIKLGGFAEVILLDTAFIDRDGDKAVPVCLVAHELRSGRQHRLFFDTPGATYTNPLPMGPDVLYVAFAAQAEWSVFLALGWQLPEDVLDLFAEFRCLTNGLEHSDENLVKPSLITALAYYGLDSMTVVEKQSMCDLILRGRPYTQEEQQQILDYCAEDVKALEKLLPAMLPELEIPYAVFRGRYTKAVGLMEFAGTPVDAPVLNRMRTHWDSLRLQLSLDVEAQFGYGVYEGTTWNDKRFEQLLERLGILHQWPRLPSIEDSFAPGNISLDDEKAFEPMALRYPVLAPLRDLRSTLLRLSSLNLPVGQDRRNRCSLAPFRSVTGRNYPPTSKFIMGQPTWVRSLVKPEPGRALAYIDWSSAEFGIAAALSGDANMKAAYESGDVYMAFAIEAGGAPKGATKASHPAIRDRFKTTLLATQYGQTATGLAFKLGEPIWRAQELLNLHRRVYARYWEWSEWMVQTATFGRSIETVFRWPMHVTSKTKLRTVANFPMQANGSEMLRWACCYAVERGIEIHAPVQDALLVGGYIEDIKYVVKRTQEAMAEASALVLNGFVLRSDAKVVKFPDRYFDERGTAMWNRVMKLLDSEEARL